MSREDNFSNTPDEMWLSAAITDFAKTVRDQCRAEREAVFAHVTASRDKQTVAAWRSIEHDIDAELARRKRPT